MKEGKRADNLACEEALAALFSHVGRYYATAMAHGFKRIGPSRVQEGVSMMVLLRRSCAAGDIRMDAPGGDGVA